MVEVSSEENLGPLGKVLGLYKELKEAGKLHFLTPKQSQAELDETIANAEEFERTFKQDMKGKFGLNL